MTLKLQSLLKKKEQLDAQIQSTKSRVAHQQRKEDTRRKILVGACFLERYQKKNADEKLLAILDVFLVREKDRALFKLPPKNNDTQVE